MNVTNTSSSFALKAKILIVEDQFIEAKSLNVILTNAGYATCTIARSVNAALSIIENEKPDLVLVDIFLQGEGTGIDLGKILNEKKMAFVYLSANSNRQILEEAKPTKPYGFMVKPFRAKDVLIMLDVALYLHKNRQDDEMNVASSHKAAPVVLPPEFNHLVGKSPKFHGNIGAGQNGWFHGYLRADIGRKWYRKRNDRTFHSQSFCETL